MGIGVQKVIRGPERSLDLHNGLTTRLQSSVGANSWVNYFVMVPARTEDMEKARELFCDK